MIKLADVIEEIISSNAWFLYGMNSEILNLTKFAKLIKPQIEARLKKEVSDASVLMALSRYQKEANRKVMHLPSFRFSNINLNSGLVSVNYFNTADVHDQLNRFYNYVIAGKRFVTLIEGVGEINLITESVYIDNLSDFLSVEPKNLESGISAITLKYSEEYIDVPGFLFFVIQQLYLQNVSIVDVSSTFTELTIFLKTSEAKLAFDTLYPFCVS